MAKVKVRTIHREELPGIAILRDAVAADLAAYPSSSGTLDLEMDTDPELGHLLAHDPDGFFTAYERDETLGFAAAHVRGRQCILSELWVLPQHHGRGAGKALLSRILSYGERSGAREFLAVVPTEPAIQALMLGHGFEPMTTVYQFSLPVSSATRLASGLTGLLPGTDATNDLLNRRGQADIDRIDRVTRNFSREADHVFWLKKRHLRVALVQQGARIAAYGYGGVEQVGPVAGSTQDAALAALGWALDLAVNAGATGDIELRVPSPFGSAVEALLDSDARLSATLLVYGKGISLSFDRSLFGTLCLP
ncbi:MAG: GNAT family N-acetyltransferase [Thermoanaerobaculales bacterium]|nr:GNAT family N-acetyltransferase [Thermoanaerobaculales bacterium]